MIKVIQITIISFSFVCFPFLSLYSQLIKKEQKGKVTVTTMDKSSKAKGYITEIADSALIVTNLITSDSHIINVNVMDEIKIKRKGGLQRGLFFGALVDFASGTLMGYASGDDPRRCLYCLTAEAKALFGGLALSVPGAIIGGIIGQNAKVKIPIKGSQQAYDRQKEKLKKYKLSFGN